MISAQQLDAQEPHMRQPHRRTAAPSLVHMQEQLTLPGFDSPPAAAPRRVGARYKLFIALFPQQAQAQRIAQHAEHWRQQHGLRAPALPASRLHVTLQVLGDYTEAPASTVVQRAVSALDEVVHPAMQTGWDQLLSFPGNGALVLRCDASSDLAIAKLRQAVQQALARQCIDATPSRTPHMTLLYDGRRIVPAQPIDPLCWMATEIAMILSHLGKHRHQLLCRRPLLPPSEPGGHTCGTDAGPPSQRRTSPRP